MQVHTYFRTFKQEQQDNYREQQERFHAKCDAIEARLKARTIQAIRGNEDRQPQENRR